MWKQGKKELHLEKRRQEGQQENTTHKTRNRKTDKEPDYKATNLFTEYTAHSDDQH